MLYTMGITLQQYRAIIGTWFGGTPKQLRGINKNSTTGHLFESKESMWIRGPGTLKLNRTHTIICLCLIVVWILVISAPERKTSSSAVPSCHTNSNVSRLEVENSTPLAAQCQALLLVLGGVETNPGPSDNTAESQQRIIADLLTQTQDGDVKEVLKAYNPTHTHKQQTKEIGKQSVAKLKSASNFLKVKGGQALLKPALIQAIIVRIQNLLPDKCDICEENYTIGLDDKPLLSCCICGQGAHDRCISRFVDNATEPVLKIPGTHWMCAACEKGIIPDPAGTATEQRHTQRTDRPDTQDEPETDTEQEESSVGEEVYQGNQEMDQDRNNETETPPVCAHYKKGVCRYGISGKGCRFSHPKPCSKLMNYGTKSPRGCSLGRKKCPNFHPKMCPQSIRHGECISSECKFQHVRGTRRIPFSSEYQCITC